MPPANECIESPDCKLPKGLRSPQALFFGEMAQRPFCLFSVSKAAAIRASTGFVMGGQFWFKGCEFNAYRLPGCKPQTLQTSVCNLTVAQCRAVASRMGLSPGRTPFAWAYIPPGGHNNTSDHHHRHKHHRVQLSVKVVMVVTITAYC